MEAFTGEYKIAYNIRVRKLAARRVNYLCGQVGERGRLSSSTSAYITAGTISMSDQIRDVNDRLLRKLAVGIVPSKVAVVLQKIEWR